MLRALTFAGIAAIAGRQLYKRGAFDRLRDDYQRRLDERRSGRPLAAQRPSTSMMQSPPAG